MDKVRRPSVIDSIRNPREVEFFRKQKGFVLLAVDAPIEVRFARVRARGRDESAATLDEFRRKEELEMAGSETSQQLALCMAMADWTIVNDGTIEELRRKVEERL
jgi:dephospho-CoA kinase